MNDRAEGKLRLEYQVEVHGEEKDNILPFVIGVVADLSGDPPESRPPWPDREFRDVNRESLETMREEFGPGGSEETWRGLGLLVREIGTDESLKIRVIDASREELAAMFGEYGGDAWDQSPLFKQTHEETYGRFMGEPYTLLIADYRLTETDEDARIRRELERIGEAVATPVLWPAEGQPAEAIYSLVAEIGRAVREEGWCGGLEKPAWADAAGLDFEGVRGLLCSGPFVHLMKSIVRDRIGNFKTPQDMEHWLNMCLEQYVAPEPAEVCVSRPLLEASLRLGDNTEHPWFFHTKISVRPAYRLDDPGPAHELVTRLPGIRSK